ncbi:branched-chain amino acid transaminase [Candidatus Tisiphia endosymbiont of Nemotelus uliginosus]|uniref:branched-chain amino acid transaminase n=1 Tax=Candidatus Tisiphia endosymbiont of Nemotelus uliginosus TaxID=3077926 RepID=UPI0035C8D082
MSGNNQSIKTTSTPCPYIWINGEFIAVNDAKISVLTHSLHYSGGVFEGERAYNGAVFKLEKHTTRLLESAKILHLDVPYSADDIIKAHHLLIEKNNIKDAYIRPLIWHGSESLNITNPALSVNLLIAAINSAPKPSTSLNLHIAQFRKPHPNSLPPQCKSSGHYNMMITIQKEAKSLGYDDAIVLDWQGLIAECTVANIFFVQDEQLFTPIADRFLNGITRQVVLDIARTIGLEVKEARITIEQLKEFKEGFITGTSVEIKGINSINCGKETVMFKEDKITNLLKAKYRELVSAIM